MTSWRSARCRTASERSWSTSSVSVTAYSGPESTTASTRPLGGEDLLEVARGRVVTARSESGERELARLVADEAEVGRERLARDLRNRHSAPPRLPLERGSEVDRNRDGGALHTRIIASDRAL